MRKKPTIDNPSCSTISAVTLENNLVLGCVPKAYIQIDLNNAEILAYIKGFPVFTDMVIRW